MQSLELVGFRAMGAFLFFGSAIAAYASVTLFWPGTILDRAWELNPQGHQAFASLGRVAGIPFLALSWASVVAGIGWFRKLRWGWSLTTIIILLQFAGSLINLLRRQYLAGSFGLLITCALLSYLIRPSVRGLFSHRRKAEPDL